MSYKDIIKLEGFDWDDGNRNKNFLKHNVSEGESEEIFFNAPLLIAEDLKHSYTEHRFVAFGVTNAGRYLTVIFTRRQKNLIRVISARDMNCKEREYYNSL